jgi:hypothetical protein
MEAEKFRKPVTLPIDGLEVFDGIPEVTNVNYNLSLLRIKLEFSDANHSVYISFDSVRGFRVLDEGDLLEFWDPGSRAQGWLWHVEEGGWFDLEKLRDGFMSGVNGVYKEFLVVGQNECVSVIANGDPIFEKSEP